MYKMNLSNIFDFLKSSKYCKQCGSKLIDKEYLEEYDRLTGKPKMNKIKVCSKDEHHYIYSTGRDM